MSNSNENGQTNNYNSSRFPPNNKTMLAESTFKNKIAYITGGGTGLGKEMALMLSKLGANVIIVSRKISVLEKTANEIQNQTSNKVIFYAADIRDPNEVNKSVDHCETTFGRLPDIIINNAAANFISPTERLSPNAFKTIVDIVLIGTINVTLVIGKRLIKQKQGATFLSILANYIYSGTGFAVPSACSKAGIATLTRSLAAEWGRYGIRLNAISPGPIYTEGAFSRLDPTGQFQKEGPKRVPVGRLGTPHELANLVAYTVSDYSSWLNGEIIFFDGGESVFLAGEFNELVNAVDDSQWDMIESMIRSNNNKSKL